MRLLLLVILGLPLCAQDMPMRFYVMAILEKGHMANIGKLAKEGYSAKGIGILPAPK